MSIFDVLKYQNTDLSSEEELLKLPEELINLYWNKFSLSKIQRHRKFKCECLAQWFYIEAYNCVLKENFDEALKEYNNESI